MKDVFFLMILLIINFKSFSQVNPSNLKVESTPDYPRSIYNDFFGKEVYSINDALLFIVSKRNQIKAFSSDDEIGEIKSYDEFPSTVESDLVKIIEDLKKMRSFIYINKSLHLNGNEVVTALKNLIDDSNGILNHINLYSPWPKLSELRNPPKEITNIVPDCCGYMYWYNNFLFIVAHLYEITDPESEFIKLQVEFTDREIYKKKFSKGFAKSVPYYEVKESLLFGRDLVISDIKNLIESLGDYKERLENFNLNIPNINEKNERIYLINQTMVKKYIKKNKDDAKKWIDSTEAISKSLRDSVIYYDKLISANSAIYRSAQREIESNEDLILENRSKVDNLSKEILEILGVLETLRKEANLLLADCDDETATDKCVKEPEKLKEISKNIETNFQTFNDLSIQKAKIVDDIIKKSAENLRLSKESDTAYAAFVIARNKYSPTAAKFQRNQIEIKENYGFNRKKYYFFSEKESELLIAIGEKEDPTMIRIRNSLKPSSNTTKVQSKPLKPWDTGWTDPQRGDLLKQLNFENYRINLDTNQN